MIGCRAIDSVRESFVFHNVSKVDSYEVHPIHVACLEGFKVDFIATDPW